MGLLTRDRLAPAFSGKSTLLIIWRSKSDLIVSRWASTFVGCRPLINRPGTCRTFSFSTFLLRKSDLHFSALCAPRAPQISSSTTWERSRKTHGGSTPLSSLRTECDGVLILLQVRSME